MQWISNQRTANPLSHPSKYHPSQSTTQLERETEFIISLTPLCFVSELCVVFIGQIYYSVSAGCVTVPPPKEVRGSSPVRLPCTPLLVFSSVLDLGRMTELLRNFSALCLNQPARMLSLGSARSSVTSLPTLTWPRFVEI